MTTLYLLLAGAFFIYFYWFLPARLRGNFILTASVLFLGLLDVKFLLWHLTSAILNFAAALLVQRSKNKALVLALAISTCNIGFIFLYRYGIGAMEGSLVSFGISYFTLINLGYFLEVYRGQVAPLRKFKDFYMFSSFFPCVLLGPIERVQSLLPQLKDLRSFKGHFLSEGVFLISLGIFKKFVLADRLHYLAQRDLGFVDSYSGVGLWFFCVLALLQIYCDFSAYIDISRGFAKTLGIHLSLNFDRPYLARSVPEVWQRWNITLVNWLRTYLFAPIMLKTQNFYFATMVVMASMALWHELSVLFLMWGLYWTLLYAIHYGLRVRGHRNLLKNIFFERVLMIVLMSFGSLFFVARDLSHLEILLGRLFNVTSFSWIEMSGLSGRGLAIVLFGVLMMLVAEWMEATSRFASRPFVKSLVSISLLFFVMLLGMPQSQAFIYMRF
jgi:D-alanyl-lipoteichoic acid acyltransferase DltB (MBOAT superfamily)